MDEGLCEECKALMEIEQPPRQLALLPRDELGVRLTIRYSSSSPANAAQRGEKRSLDPQQKTRQDD